MEEGYSQNDFLKYKDSIGQDSYYYDESQDPNNYLESINSIYKNTEKDLSWLNFRYLLLEKKIKIERKPSLGWFFKEKSTMGDDLLYTFEKYKNIISENKKEENYGGEKLTRRERMDRGEGLYNPKKAERQYELYKDSLKIIEQMKKRGENYQMLRERMPAAVLRSRFKNNYPKIIEIYKNFIMDNDQQLNNLLDYLLEERNLFEPEAYDYLIEEARRKYNFEKDQYNENVKKFSTLSVGMKEKTKEMGKNLDKFILKLKPIVKEYNSRNKSRDESLRSKILDEEKKQKQQFEEEMKLEKKKKDEEMKKANEEIENLEYKIRDAQSKYSMNRAKLRKLDSRLKDLQKLEKRKKELETKLREKNLSIEKRQDILKQKTELNEKLANIDSVRDQLADLKSKIPNPKTFKFEREFREYELNKFKKMNDASIRQKNALFRSLELEKIKQEIAIHEEQRYQQEQREKEESKQAKIVFLKEKKISEKRINELNIIRKTQENQSKVMKEMEEDFSKQKKFLEEIKSMKESKLKEKKLQIEQKKLRTLELEKEKLLRKQNYAEQQKLLQDTIEKDVKDLELEKQTLQNLTVENKKILENTKREISARQLEIEKNIKLNLENVKIRESKIFAEEAKIKLDVFQTLSDVKEQTAIKLNVENILEDLKEEIIRKEDVSSLLSETVRQIAFNEISEVENYNSFLKSEIDFKKKLTDKNLSQKEILEILTEEKQSYINFLKEVKSFKLKEILNAKRDIAEQNIKIVLTEKKENLKNVTSVMKYEMENLEKEKEISERKKDLAEFQNDNYKRELKLRKQEIELLKNIRVKVLENDRKTRRLEAQKAISDIVKSIEKDERNQEVKEKLDEILDDVETKEISKTTLFSIIDKIENKEIHDAAKEKLDFILGKIEVHDNIEESRKVLNNILDKIEDKQIRKDVEEKLDEILDDVDYDFLDDDDLDTFLSNVRKHISGEKKMEQFSKISEILDEVKEEDIKLKMEENIEMKERGQKVGPEDYETGETSFDQFSDYNFFINNIEDPILKEKTRTFLGNVDGFEKESEKIPKIKNAYKSAVNSALWDDQLDLDYWDGNIIQDENAKFLYEQKVNNINTALIDYDIHIDPADTRVREFLDIKLTETFSEKKGEINGYKYNGEKIISRNISRNFFFNYIKKPLVCQKFINELKEVINKTAKSQIASESYFEGRAVKDCALEYIGELREEQSYQIDSARNATEMRNALRDANDMEKEIKNIKKNSSFKIRLKIFRRTLSWRITKLLRLLWKHKGRSVTIIGSLILAGIGLLLNQLGVIAVVHNLKKAARSVKQYANDVHEMGKRIIENVQSLYRIPGQILGWSLILFAFFLRLLYFFTRLGGTASSSWIFGIFGTIIELSLYFSTNIETINEKASEVLEETGNIIENAGIRSQKYIAKNMPRWYYDKPKEKRTILENIEAGAANIIFKVAEGTQYTGKKVQDAGETIKSTLYYMQAFMILSFSLLLLVFIRNYLL